MNHIPTLQTPIGTPVTPGGTVTLPPFKFAFWVQLVQRDTGVLRVIPSLHRLLDDDVSSRPVRLMSGS